MRIKKRDCRRGSSVKSLSKMKKCRKGDAGKRSEEGNEVGQNRVH